MKIKLLTIALITIAAFSLTAIYLPETSAQRKPETCKVNKANTDLFVSATEKTIKLKKGTLLSWSEGGIHQGIIAVKAKIGKKWVRGEIKIDSTSCV